MYRTSRTVKPSFFRELYLDKKTEIRYSVTVKRKSSEL